MKISAVTVCVGYGDFLRESVAWNRHHFDKWVIVTSPDDTETREVCRQNRLTCLVTKDHERDGTFSKGRAIERGLQQLPADDWILHIDADVVLPLSFHDDITRAHLDPAMVYGADRIMVRSWAEWQAFQKTGWLQRTTGDWSPHAVAVPPGFSIGARWVGPDGFAPIGFLQLWHRVEGGEEWRGVRTKPYPSGHGSACREDVQFGLLWDRRQRVLIPELFVVHLESEPAATGTNWKGRTTRRFGPETAAVAQASIGWIQKYPNTKPPGSIS